MRFLADESCDFAVVRALRATGYDVHAIAQLTPGLTDQAVLALASAEQRVLLTEDKDFGELVFAGASATGVVALRPGSVLRLDADLRFDGRRDEAALVSVVVHLREIVDGNRHAGRPDDLRP